MIQVERAFRRFRPDCSPVNLATHSREPLDINICQRLTDQHKSQTPPGCLSSLFGSGPAHCS